MSDNTSEDLMLIEKSRAGDRAAFDALVTKYEKRAYQYAYRLTGTSDDAADIVVDAFIRVYNALHSFKGNSAFTTWLYRIITNCCLDAKKKQRSRYAVSLDSAMEGEEGGEMTRQVIDEGDGPEVLTERRQREALVQKALTLMPEYQRAMLVMYHVDSLSYEEIAESLDLPIGTVKSRLNRARLGLRDLLQKDKELFQL